MARKFLIFSFTIIFATSAFAQDSNSGSGTDDAQTKSRGITGPRKQLATILFSGLGGAILGLSTLSFYGRPQDKLANIAIGFAVGVIAGTVYVTYKAANNPRELYGYNFEPEFERLERERATRIDSTLPLNASYTFSF